MGFRVCHWQPERLSDVILGHNPRPDFRRYDDVHAVLDLPAALFYRELLDTYPSSRVILTVRDEAKWFESVWKHYVWVHENLEGSMLKEAIITQQMAYGTTRPNEYVYRKRFREHNAAVMETANDVLVMDICGGDGWQKLCEWLHMPVPSFPFPRVDQNLKPYPLAVSHSD
jgi:hypothetical protein